LTYQALKTIGRGPCPRYHHSACYF